MPLGDKPIGEYETYGRSLGWRSRHSPLPSPGTANSDLTHETNGMFLLGVE